MVNSQTLYYIKPGMKKNLSFLLLLIAVGFTHVNQQTPFGDHYWTIESATIQPALDLDMDGKPDTDLLSIVPTCERDDADLFKPGGQLYTHRGTARCDEEEELEEETGTWTFLDKSKRLIVERFDGNKPQEMTLVESKADRLIFQSTHESSIGKHTIRTTFRRKSS